MSGEGKEITQEFKRSAHEPPPMPRKGIVTTLTVGGVEISIRTGEYEDGRICELHVDNNHPDLNLRRSLGSVSRMITVGLQHGTPLKAFVDEYAHSKNVRHLKVDGHPDVKLAHSLMDAVMHMLAVEYRVNYGAHLALPAPEKKPAWKPHIIAGGLEMKDLK
ncbi:MAG: hypothetical protein LRZ85_08475 [Alphaproteobacteria bacterium]|nr:hypothetical protein [Alphaproteobacteria bacterium]MCD8570123.1 hypothetical protein [Alphaproteobacteria bacterium]